MDRGEFEATLAKEGFAQIVAVERDPDGFLDLHTHPFEAKALILSGEIRIRTGGVEQAYRAGEVFHLPANEPHSEWYGPTGVVYLVGRR